MQIEKDLLGIPLFSGLALIVSLYIYYMVSAHQILPGCSGENCDAVLQSRWQRWGWVSVADLGIGGYLVMAACSLCLSLGICSAWRFPLWMVLVLQSMVGAGFVVWLMLLQWVVLHHFCKYCLLAHIFGLLAYLLVWIHTPVWKRIRYAGLKFSSAAATILAFLIGVHILFVPDQIVVAAADHAALTVDEQQSMSSSTMRFGKPAQSRSVALLDDALNFDLYKVPITGDYNAKYVVLDLFDYACPSCRNLHHKLDEFIRENNISLAVVCLPAPMNPDCNPHVKRAPKGFQHSCAYARFALAVNQADPKQFAAYNDFLMTGGWPPSVEKARARAEELVGAEAFADALESDAVKQWIEDGINIYQYIKGKSLPKLITAHDVISYSGGSKAGFRKIMFKALDLTE